MTDPRTSVPPLRIRALNRERVRPDGEFVLYWMTAYRRTGWNFALQRAADWARHLRKPLVVLSALRLDYQWATERSHSFILDSMADVEGTLQGTEALVFSYVEPTPGAGKGLLPALASEASLVVVDDAPIFFLPAMTSAAARRIGVLMEGVDHNGLMPLAETDRVFRRAYDLRRYLQRHLASHLDGSPEADPLAGLPPAPPGLLAEYDRRWRSAGLGEAASTLRGLDRSVGASAEGGQNQGRVVLDRFVSERLAGYGDRSLREPFSGLSPYLHYGNVASHEVFAKVARVEGWNPPRLGGDLRGARSGWWGMSASAERFLDQLITWRELGYRAAHYVPGNDEYSSLPAWARATLGKHTSDPRDHIYTLEQFDSAETHDELWNMAQTQLRNEGVIHSYLRMLWGKKILEWARHPEEAHDIMFELNNRYALDGRDPNSVSGIHWVLGRYDRPWGPERPVFGKVRYMSSDSTRRKLRLGQSKMLNT
jgi:deoxyribodipyrimidine photo-lyase